MAVLRRRLRVVEDRLLRLGEQRATAAHSRRVVRLKDDSILVAVNGRPKTGPPDHASLFRTTDGGENWELLSTVHTDHELQEVTVAELQDGRFVMMGRP